MIVYDVGLMERHYTGEGVVEVMQSATMQGKAVSQSCNEGELGIEKLRKDGGIFMCECSFAFAFAFLQFVVVQDRQSYFLMPPLLRLFIDPLHAPLRQSPSVHP